MLSENGNDLSIQLVATMAIEGISDITGIDKEEIITDFLSSHTAELLQDEKNKIWAEGPSLVADMYIKEKKLKSKN